MKSRGLYFSFILGLAALLAVIGGLSGCSTASAPTTPAATTTPPVVSTTLPAVSSAAPPIASSPAPLTVNVSNNAKLGGYLVDGGGMTLYMFARDTNGKSTPTGTTLANWPVFSPASFNVPAILSAADFGTITRDDGLKVATYKGWPLYHFAQDKAAGDINGDGVAGVWFAVKIPFYSVLLQSNATLGTYLADAKGMTLYYFAKDSVGKSTTTGTVLANWPLFNPANFSVTSTLNSSDFGSVTRDDGAKVAAYKGWPLYYFANDKAPGDANGQGIGGVWFVVTPANFPPTASATPTATPSPSPSATTTPAAPVPYSVVIQNFAFSPVSITIPVGSTVTWTNKDSGITHTVTSDSGVFNGSVNSGSTFSYTFTQAGTFPYHCTAHTYMVAKVIVQ